VHGEPGADAVPDEASLHHAVDEAENLRRLGEALEELGVGETGLDADEPTTFVTSHGELRVVPVPAGTRGRAPASPASCAA
jgi:hypothetical protein